MALVLKRELWDAHIEGAGYNERTIDLNDADVTAYDQAVSTATESDGFNSVWYSVFVWTAPSTSYGRLVDGMIPRIKLYASDGTELPATTQLAFGVQAPHQKAPVYFAFAAYTHWRAVAIDDQGDRLKNERLALAFENGLKVVDIKPSEKLVIALSGTSTLLDKDYASTVIELDMGIKTI